jgi:branched-chain amino acid transport system permease protein
MQQTTTAPKSTAVVRRSGAHLAWIGWAFMALVGAGALWLVLSQAVKNPTLFVQNVLDGLKLGFVYALIALGYTMVYGIVRLINFAHGDVFMVGAFVSFYAVSRFGLHLWAAAVFPGLAGVWTTLIGSFTVVLLCMIVCVVLAVTIERVAYKPLRDAPRIAALITAIGVSFFLADFGAL